jgi:hypothetical protein
LVRVIAAPPLFDVESTNVPVFEVELQSNVQFAMARDGNVVDAMAASPVPDRLTNGPLDEPLMVDDAAADELQAAASRAIPMRSAQDGTRRRAPSGPSLQLGLGAGSGSAMVMIPSRG